MADRLAGRFLDRWAAKRLGRDLHRMKQEQAGDLTADQFTVLTYLWMVRGNDSKAELAIRMAEARR